MKTIRIMINEMILSTLFFVLMIAVSVSVKATEVPGMLPAEIEMEAAPEVESWMIDESVWNINNTSNTIVIEQEMDPILEVEPWMLDEKLFNHESFEIQPVEVEEPLKVESWMLNEKYWNIE